MAKFCHYLLFFTVISFISVIIFFGLFWPVAFIPIAGSVLLIITNSRLKKGQSSGYPLAWFSLFYILLLLAGYAFLLTVSTLSLNLFSQLFFIIVSLIYPAVYLAKMKTDRPARFHPLLMTVIILIIGFIVNIFYVYFTQPIEEVTQ